MAAVTIAVTRGVQPATGAPARRLGQILPEVNDQHRLDLVREALLNDLGNIDRNTRWSDTRFVPLQAQVQIHSSTGMRSRIVDLISALRSNQDARIFVVLGDPGSGKSVAMRKLARDLLSENTAGRIPIYFNLKEWKINRELREDTPPTTSEFSQFIRENLKSRLLDFALQDFLFSEKEGKSIFELLRESGYLFFIFDSFDEIPAVLDHEENSWVVDQLSNCIASYAVAGLEARGVIASRLFRKPRVDQSKQATLEIRPFSEEKIIQAINRAKPRNSSFLIENVLSKRPDLGFVAKNPFLLNLIILHYSYTGSLPTSQKEVFETYLLRNIEYARENPQFRDFSPELIYSISEKIALAMLGETVSSLEIDKSDLQARVDDTNLNRSIEFLIRSRIARLSNDNEIFSFSHRRFNEFFLVRALERGSVPIPFDAIQTDNKWRDALVLYTEISTERDAQLLANHAWAFARKLGHLEIAKDWPEFIESRHALRFLIDGFRNRPWILPMRSDLALLIKNKIKQDVDLIEKRTLIEAITLLEPSSALPIIERVFRKHQGWLSEGAATAARYLPSIAPSLALAFYHHATHRPGFESLSQAKTYSQTLYISDATRKIALWLRLYRLDFLKDLLIAALIQIAAVLKYGPAAMAFSLFAAATYIIFRYGFVFVELSGVVSAIDARMNSNRPLKKQRLHRTRTSLFEVGPVMLKMVILASLMLPISLSATTYVFSGVEPADLIQGDYQSAPEKSLSFVKSLDAATVGFLTLLFLAVLAPVQPPPYLEFARVGRKRLVGLVLGFCLSIFSSMLVFFLLAKLIPLHYVKYILTASGLIPIGMCVISMWYAVHDAIHLRRSRISFDGSRISIARDFS